MPGVNGVYAVADLFPKALWFAPPALRSVKNTITPNCMRVRGTKKKRIDFVKKALATLKKILTVIVVTIAALMTVFTVVSSITLGGAQRSLFGYNFFVSLSDSMSKTDFDAGDIVISRHVDPSTLKEGDIISFISQNPENFGETVTHKIRSVSVNDKGEPCFITYGTTTDTDDKTPVLYRFVLGKYCGKLSKVGYFFDFLKTTKGYIVCIFIPFLFLIGIQGLDCVRLFRKYKQEETALINKEREALEKQQEENKRLLEELNNLRNRFVENEDTKFDNTDRPSI